MSEQQVCGATIPVEFDKWQSVEVRVDGSRIICGAPIRLRSGPCSVCHHDNHEDDMCTPCLILVCAGDDKPENLAHDDPGGYEHYEETMEDQSRTLTYPTVDLGHEAVPSPEGSEGGE